MLSEFSGSPPSIRITEPATPIPVTGWTPFLDHGFLGPFDSGPSKAFQHRQFREYWNLQRNPYSVWSKLFEVALKPPKGKSRQVTWQRRKKTFLGNVALSP